MDKKFLFKNYIKDGYLISESLLREDEILTFRSELDEEFVDHKKEEGVRRDLDKFKNTELSQKIINLFSSDQISTIQKELEKISKTKVSILPPLEVHKNYHVNLKEFHGWHRDCGGELRYNYCKNILSTENYLFSKVGIYLQNNGEYGGSIDIIKTSHRNFEKAKVLIRKIKNLPLKLISTLHKYLNKIYFIIPEAFFMFLLNGKRLHPEKGSAVFFDSRLIHRGSPISKKNLRNVEYVSGEYKAVLPKSFDKYSLYCHFGTTEAVDSYMFDRLKRKGNTDELKKWVDQIKFISKYNEKLSYEMNSVIEPVKQKYKEYL